MERQTVSADCLAQGFCPGLTAQESCPRRAFPARAGGCSPLPGPRCRVRAPCFDSSSPAPAAPRAPCAASWSGCASDRPRATPAGVWFEGPLRMGDGGLPARARRGAGAAAGRRLCRGARPTSSTQGTRAVDWTALADDQEHARGPRQHPRPEAGAAPGLTHSGYAALKVKDAVVDTLRDKLGARPDVDPKDPDVGLVLHLAGARAGLFLDLAGEPLHRRGYRVAMIDAPLKETLAAAVLALGGVPTATSRSSIRWAARGRWRSSRRWRRAGSRRGCSGASASSAGRRSTSEHRAAPGASWPTRRARRRPRGARAPAPAPIVYADIADDAVAAARRNAAAAGVAGDIEFERADVGDARTLAPALAARDGVHQPALRRAPGRARSGARSTGAWRPRSSGSAAVGGAWCCRAIRC